MFFRNVRSLFLIAVLIFYPVGNVRTAVGNRRKPMNSRFEGVVLGDYLFLKETNYFTSSRPFLNLKTAEETECRCFCSGQRQCLAVIYHRSEQICSLYGTDPCDTKSWQTNSDTNFYIHINRLKYRIYDHPEQNQRLQRLTFDSLCSTTNKFDADRRWLYVLKITGQTTSSFLGFDFDQAPNRVAPNPWTSTLSENIWHSVLMQQWTNRFYFPKYFGFALIANETVREFIYFRLHKTTIGNFFNKQHTPMSLCWNLKNNKTQLHTILDGTEKFKRLFSISFNGIPNEKTLCDQHQTFMYISPFGERDQCLFDGEDSASSLQIRFSDLCQPTPYNKLARADALIGLIAGDTTSEV